MAAVPSTVAVVGLGLIGGSVLRALAGRYPAVGYDTDPGTRELAAAAGHRVPPTLGEAVAGAGVVVLAVPLPALPPVLADLAGILPPGAVVTDVTSVKEPVRAAARGLRYVGGHPMAGTEHSGFAAGDAALFAGAAWVLCVEDDTDLRAWLELAALVTATGARVVPCTARDHDRAVARVSGLPHVLAATLALGAGDPLSRALAAGSYRDGTRVAGTRPELSAALCEGNRVALAQALDGEIDRLVEARDRLRGGAGLRDLFASGRAARELWEAARGAGSDVDLDPADHDLRVALLDLGRAGGHVTGVQLDRLRCWRPTAG